MGLNILMFHKEWIKEFGIVEFAQLMIARATNNTKKIDLVYERILSSYATKAIEVINNEKPNCNKSIDTIWTLWWSGEDSMPPLAKIGLMSIRKNSSGYRVVLLDQNNIADYVDIPLFYYDLLKQGKISVIHFCDILRIRILRDRGGVWLDSTIFLGREIPHNILNYKVYSAKRVPDGFRNISSGRWAGNFISTNEINNRLFRALVSLYDLYFADHKMIITYFMLDYCIDLLVKQDEIIAKMINEIPLNNPNIKKLNILLYETFDNNEWVKMISDTYAFKLNWRKYDKEKSNLSGTYYQFLLNSIEKQ